jgi:uncharacterized membrane protein YgcG
MATPLRPQPKDQASASDLMDAMHTSLIDPPTSSYTTTNTTPSDHAEPRIPSDPSLQATTIKPRPHSSSSADLILPILIYLIVRANPKRLISNLDYVNRFRYHRLVKGEVDYCLVNFSVCCEFIKSFVGLEGLEALQTASMMQVEERTEANHDQDSSVSSTPRGAFSTMRAGGYGTFSPSIRKRGREKSGSNDVEEALMAASRAVGGVLMGGYQRVISSSLLDAPAAKLGFAGGTNSGGGGSGGGTRSAPRTLEDVKKLIGSGSGSGSGGGGGSWSTRVGLLRRTAPTDAASPARLLPASVVPPAAAAPASSGSNAVKRLSSLFQHHHSAAGPSPARPLSHPEIDRASLGQRFSSLPGLARLAPDPPRPREMSGLHDAISGQYIMRSSLCTSCLHLAQKKKKKKLTSVPMLGLFSRRSSADYDSAVASPPAADTHPDNTAAASGHTPAGPIARLEQCASSDQLRIADIPRKRIFFFFPCPIYKQSVASRVC